MNVHHFTQESLKNAQEQHRKQHAQIQHLQTLQEIPIVYEGEGGGGKEEKGKGEEARLKERLEELTILLEREKEWGGRRERETEEGRGLQRWGGEGEREKEGRKKRGGGR